MVKVDDLRGSSVDELQTKCEKLKKDLMHLRFQSKTGKLERQGAIKETKKDIARIMTVISELEREKAAS